MRNSAVATHPRLRGKSSSPQTHSSTPLFATLIALVALVALGFGLFLFLRPFGTNAAASGSEHSLGATTAPVVVDEYGDFE